MKYKLKGILAFLSLCVVVACNDIKQKKISPSVSESLFVSSSKAQDSIELPQTLPQRFIYSESLYFDSIGSGLRITNSFPKGGAYYGSKGNNYGYGIFFTSIQNELNTPVEFTIHFPTKVISIYNTVQSEVELFLPQDKFRIDKLELLDYGVEDLSFFENHSSIYKVATKRLASKEKIGFYVAILFRNTGGGPVRTGFALQGKALSYELKLNGGIDNKSIDCGKLIFAQSY